MAKRILTPRFSTHFSTPLDAATSSRPQNKVIPIGKAESAIKAAKNIIAGTWKGNRLDGRKFTLALMQHRNSPAQKLYGRSIQDTLEAHRRSFNPAFQRMEEESPPDNINGLVFSHFNKNEDATTDHEQKNSEQGEDKPTIEAADGVVKKREGTVGWGRKRIAGQLRHI